MARELNEFLKTISVHEFPAMVELLETISLLPPALSWIVSKEPPNESPVWLSTRLPVEVTVGAVSVSVRVHDVPPKAPRFILSRAIVLLSEARCDRSSHCDGLLDDSMIERRVR